MLLDFVYSAGQILGLPFVKKHLADFIAEKQTLLQQKFRESTNGLPSAINPSSSLRQKGIFKRYNLIKIRCLFHFLLIAFFVSSLKQQSTDRHVAPL